MTKQTYSTTADDYYSQPHCYQIGTSFKQKLITLEPEEHNYHPVAGAQINTHTHTVWADLVDSLSLCSHIMNSFTNCIKAISLSNIIPYSENVSTLHTFISKCYSNNASDTMELWYLEELHCNVAMWKSSCIMQVIMQYCRGGKVYIKFLQFTVYCVRYWNPQVTFSQSIEVVI